MVLTRWERSLMFFTFLVMAGIEVSLLIDKPGARYFAVTILAVGLVMRELAKERAARKQRKAEAGASATVPMGGMADAVGHEMTPQALDFDADDAPILAAIRGKGRTLDFALKEAAKLERTLYLLFVREQTVITAEDRRRKWINDAEAGEIFLYAKPRVHGRAMVLPCSAVRDSAAGTIVDVAATVGASRLILGSPQRSTLLNLLRGNIVRDVSSLLPEDIELVVFA